MTESKLIFVTTPLSSNYNSVNKLIQATPNVSANWVQSINTLRQCFPHSTNLVGLSLLLVDASFGALAVFEAQQILSRSGLTIGFHEIVDWSDGALKPVLNTLPLSSV